jgi:autotransporter-associated beta strand protein
MFQQRVSRRLISLRPTGYRPAGPLRRGLFVATILAVALAHGGVARAQWIQTANATYAYTGTANWNGGVINNNFSGFTLASNANPQLVTFSGSYNLGSSFNLAYDANTTGNLRFSSASGSGIQTVSFGGLWTENVTNAGASSWIAFGINGATNLNLALTDATTFDTNQTRAERKGLAIFANISGTHAITKTGTGVLSFSGSNSYAGNLAAREGDLVVSSLGTLRSVARIGLGGSTDPTRSGLLLLENRVIDINGSGGVGNSNRLNDSATIAGLGNGQLGLIGASATAVQEVTGTFANQAGLNRAYVVLQGNAGQASQVTTLTFTDVARSAGTTLGLQGGYRSAFTASSGAASFFNLGQGTGTTSPQLLATQIGGGSPTAANVNGIVPWAFVGTGYEPSAFATYGANGFKPYGFDATGTVNNNGGTEPYVTTFASGSATSNVRTAGSNAVSGTVTFNSLTMTGGSVTRSVATDTLALTSGGLMSTTSGSIGIQPRLDVNGREGVIFARGIVNLSGGIHNDGGNGVTFMATSRTSGAGVLLDGTSSYTGATRINYGDVAARVVGAIPQASDVRIDAGGSLNLWDGLSGGTVIGAISGLGRVTARNNGSVTSVLVTGSGNGSGDFGGTITNGAAGAIALTKVGSGTQTLSGSNTYTGETRVSGGVLALGSATAISGQSNLLVDGGGFNPGGYSNTVGAVTITSGSIFGSGVLTGSSYALQGGAVDSQFGTGAITVSTGTTVLGSAGRLNAASGLSITSGQLTLGGSESVASFVLTGGVLAGTGQTLTSGSAYDVRSGSVQANLGGSVGLVKSTAGTVFLTGSNAFTGDTSINAGQLFLNGQLGNTALTVNAGGFLGGSGSVLGSVAVLAGGTFAPGNSPGLFTAGSMTLSGVTLMEIDATGVRGTAYDAVTVTNALTYGGLMEIDLAFASALEDNTIFNLFDFGSQSGFLTAITTKGNGSYYGGLSFTGTGDVRTATKGGQTLEFTYSTGNLVIVPEPAACCTAAIGALAAIGYAARRARRQS